MSLKILLWVPKYYEKCKNSTKSVKILRRANSTMSAKILQRVKILRWAPKYYKECRNTQISG